MADSYNSKYTGSQVDDAVARTQTSVASVGAITNDAVVVGNTANGENRGLKVATLTDNTTTMTRSDLNIAIDRATNYSTKGVSTDAQELTSNKIAVGDGSHKVTVSNVAIGDVSTAISQSGAYNTKGVSVHDAENSLPSGNIIVGNGTHEVKDSEVALSTVSTAVERATDYNSYGVSLESEDTTKLTDAKLVIGKGGQKVATSGITAANVVTSANEIGTGKLVAGNADNKTIAATAIESTDVTKTIDSTLTAGVGFVAARQGTIRLDAVPNFDYASPNLKIYRGGSSSISGAPILYYGRNIVDIANFHPAPNIYNWVDGGMTFTATTFADESAIPTSSTRYIYPTAVGAFGIESTISAPGSTKKTIAGIYNHSYLIMVRTANLGEHVTVNTVSLYDGTTSLTSAALTSSQVSEGGVTYNDYYAILKPTWTYSQASHNNKTVHFAITASNSNAEAAEGLTVIGACVIDLTEQCDEHLSLANAYARYDDLIVGNGTIYLESDKLIYMPHYIDSANPGPEYYYAPSSRYYYGRVPSDRVLYVQQYTSAATNSSTTVGSTGYKYIGTASVVYNGGNGKKLSINQATGLNIETCRIVFASTTAGSRPSEIPLPTYANAPLLQMISSQESSASEATLRAKYWGNTTTSGSLYVNYIHPINLINGNSLDSDNYAHSANTGTFGTTEVITLEGGLAQYATGYAQNIIGGKGIIALQPTSAFSSVFATSIENPENNKARMVYSVNSVNSAIQGLSNQVQDIEELSLISTLPTAVGTYKYEVTSEGTPGTWTKEEETVIIVTAWDPTFQYDMANRAHKLALRYDKTHQLLYVSCYVAYAGTKQSGNSNKHIYTIENSEIKSKLNALALMNISSIIIRGGGNGFGSSSLRIILNAYGSATDKVGDIQLDLDGGGNGIGICGVIDLKAH